MLEICKNEMKNNFQPEWFPALIPRITDYLAFIVFQDSQHLYFRRDFFRRWSQILLGISPSIRENDAIQNVSAMQDIAETILKTGHFVTQLCGLEVLLKYLGCCSDKNIVTKILTLQEFKSVREMLISFDNTNFDIDARHFLNEYNMRISKEKLVYSLFVFGGYIGNFNIKKPTSGERRLDLWVDFNYYTKTVSFYFNSLTFSAEEDSFWVNVEMEIFNINIKRTENELVVIPSKIISIDPPTNFDKDISHAGAFRFIFDEPDIEKLLEIIEDFQLKNESQKCITKTPKTKADSSLDTRSIAMGESISDTNSIFSKSVKKMSSHQNRKNLNVDFNRFHSQKNVSKQTPTLKIMQSSEHKISIERKSDARFQYSSHNLLETTHFIKRDKLCPMLKDITNSSNLNLSASITATTTNCQKFKLSRQNKLTAKNKKKIEKENKVVKQKVSTVVKIKKYIRSSAQGQASTAKVSTKKKLNFCHLIKPLNLNVAQNEEVSSCIKNTGKPNFQEIVEEYVSNSGYVGINNALKDQMQTSKLAKKELEFLKVNVETLNKIIENATSKCFKRERTSPTHSDIYDIRKFLSKETLSLKKKNNTVKKHTVKKYYLENKSMKIQKHCAGNKNSFAIQKDLPLEKFSSTAMEIIPMKDNNNIEQKSVENLYVNKNNNDVNSSSIKPSLENQSRLSQQATTTKDINTSQIINGSLSDNSGRALSINDDTQIKLQQFRKESIRSERKSCDKSDAVNEGFDSLEANCTNQNIEVYKFPFTSQNTHLSPETSIHNSSAKLSAEDANSTTQNSIEEFRAVFHSPVSDIIHFHGDFSIDQDHQMNYDSFSLQEKSRSPTFVDNHANSAKNSITTIQNNSSICTPCFKKFRRDALTPNICNEPDVSNSISFNSLVVASRSTASYIDISSNLERVADTGKSIALSNNFEENDVDIITDNHANSAKNSTTTIENNNNICTPSLKKFRRDALTPNICNKSDLSNYVSYNSLAVPSRTTASNNGISSNLETVADTGESIAYSNNFEEYASDVDIITDRLLNGNGTESTKMLANTLLQNLEKERNGPQTLLDIKIIIEFIKENQERHLIKSANLLENIEKMQAQLLAEIENFCNISTLSTSQLRRLSLKLNNLNEILKNDNGDMESIFNNLLCDFENECKVILSLQWKKYINSTEKCVTEHLKNVMNSSNYDE